MQGAGTQHERRLVARALPVRSGEGWLVLLCGGCFFFLLFGYFLLRPIREAMGVQRSMGDLRTLFIATCVISLLVTLAFGGVVSRFERKRFIAIGYRAVIVLLGLFIAALLLLPEDMKIYSGYAYYIGLSVVNLFMTSVFWGFMADVWSLSQGKRLFAAIGIGGTLGALLGSNFVWWLAERIEPWMQILVAMVAFEIAVQVVRLIDRKTSVLRQSHTLDHGGEHGSEHIGDGARAHPTRAASTDTCGVMAPVGGHWIDGIKALCSSPYLLGIGLYITLLAVSNTLIYFTQASLVVDSSDELSGRIALFAQLDMWTQLATLLVQLFVTAHLIKKLGIGVALALLPVVTLVGFVALAWVSGIEGIAGWQVFGVFAAFNAIYRATRYAVIRPARETLFAVVPTSEKYKAKPIVDVFLYRGGDVAGAGVEKAIAAAGLGLIGMAMVAAPLAVLWGMLAFALAAAQHKRAQHDEYNGIERNFTPTPGQALGQTGSRI